MTEFSFKFLDQEEATNALSKVRLSNNAKMIMQFVIEDVWLGKSFSDNYIESIFEDKSLGISENEAIKAVRDLVDLGLIERNADYGFDYYFISINKFLQLRNQPKQVRTRDELKAMLKLVVSN